MATAKMININKPNVANKLVEYILKKLNEIKNPQKILRI
jgi:hypothetical protein